MNQVITFGSDGNNDYLPALSDGANVKLKILTAPEKYETLYGEKIKLDIEVTGINTKCEGIVVNHHYTVSSSAKCWQELHASYINPPQAIMNKNNMEMHHNLVREKNQKVKMLNSPRIPVKTVPKDLIEKFLNQNVCIFCK